MSAVDLKVDVVRRNKLKRLHTATHIVNYAARKVLGNHVWQNGSRIEEDFATLDITHYKHLTPREIVEIERLANQVVFESKEVVINEVPREEAEKKYGYVIYQGGAVPLRTLRIVEIKDIEVEACGGLHVGNTSEVKLIHVYKTEKVQDGLIRLFFVAGERALDLFMECEEIIWGLCEKYSVNRKDLSATVDKFFEKWRDNEKKVKRLQEDLLQAYFKLVKDGEEIVVSDLLSIGDFMELAKGVESIVISNSKFFLVKNMSKKPESYKRVIKKGDAEVFIL